MKLFAEFNLELRAVFTAKIHFAFISLAVKGACEANCVFDRHKKWSWALQ